MRMWKRLWNDTRGAILTAETALVGSVVLTAGAVGMSTLNNSINEELADLSRAIRSLDQSYSIPAQSGHHGASIAGSGFQDDVAADVENVGLDVFTQDAVDQPDQGREPITETAREPESESAPSRNRDVLDHSA